MSGIDGGPLELWRWVVHKQALSLIAFSVSIVARKKANGSVLQDSHHCLRNTVGLPRGTDCCTVHLDSATVTAPCQLQCSSPYEQLRTRFGTILLLLKDHILDARLCQKNSELRGRKNRDLLRICLRTSFQRVLPSSFWDQLRLQRHSSIVTRRTRVQTFKRHIRLL